MKTILVTDEEYEALKEMKEMLNTQDVRATADPIYGIMHQTTDYGIDLDFCSDSVYMSSHYDYPVPNDAIAENLYEEFFHKIQKYIIQEDIEDLEVMSDEDAEEFLWEWLEDFVSRATPMTLDDFIEEITEGEWYKVGFVKTYKPHTNSFSFFEKDAFTHLETNGHNINGKKHTFAFSNFRTPYMTKLRNILMNLNFQEEEND